MDYSTAPLPVDIFEKTIFLPQDKDSDPFIWAAICKREFKNTTPCVLIPGKVFDIHGTRHGRGRGWYDRFLSQIPASWMRVGIIDTLNLSSDCLVKQSWDEPVDWILAFNASTSFWETYESLARLK